MRITGKQSGLIYQLLGSSHGLKLAIHEITVGGAIIWPTAISPDPTINLLNGEMGTYRCRTPLSPAGHVNPTIISDSQYDYHKEKNFQAQGTPTVILT